LLPTHHCYKAGSESYLGLPKTDITAHQSIHGIATGHITNDGSNRIGLVWRFFKPKALCKGGVIMRRELKGMTFTNCARCIEIK
jgi:hypothetical protein